MRDDKKDKIIKIADFLEEDENLSIKGKDLQVLTGLKERELYARIEKEREDYDGKGYFICWCEKGYYKTRDWKKILEFLVAYTAPARRMFQLTREIKQKIDDIEGQLNFFEEENA